MVVHSDRNMLISNMPARAGVGLREEHDEDVVTMRPDTHKTGVHWFEFHPENYMGGGYSCHFLEQVADRFPLSMHGVGLSIGGAGPLDAMHLERLKQLNERYQPTLVSEHLAWSTHETRFMNDLLPLPYNDETLGVVCDHLDLMQNTLGRQVLLENPSAYLAFEDSNMDEVTFLTQVAEQSGCGLLLDINNVFISAHNMGWSANAYVDAFPFDKVGEIHLAGHLEETLDGEESLLIDTHDRLISNPVWELYERAILRAGCIPTLIEWDAKIPQWNVLLEEAEKADKILLSAVTKEHTDKSTVKNYALAG